MFCGVFSYFLVCVCVSVGCRGDGWGVEGMGEGGRVGCRGDGWGVEGMGEGGV